MITTSAPPDPPPAQAAALPSLEGARVRLRGFRAQDLDDFYLVHSDPKVMRYWSFPAWTELSQAEAYFASACAGRDPDAMLCWGITLAAADRIIGAVTLFAIDRAQQRAEIGYALGSAHWGLGLAREALQLVLGFGFDRLGLRRIEADVDPRNLASCRLVERLGFRHEGTLRERWNVAGELQDSAIFGLLARDWIATRSAHD